MEDLGKFSTDEQHPVIVTREEKEYIKEGRNDEALKRFRKPAYMLNVKSGRDVCEGK